MRKKTLKVYAWILGITIPYLIWYMTTGIGIPCFYRETLGILCPGCGITRMFANMARFEFKEAFYCNPLMFVMFFVWNLIGLLCIWDKFEFLRKTKTLYVLLFVSLFVAILFGLFRNS